MDETYTPSFHEICSKVNNAKDKAKKIGVLRKYRSECLEMFLNSGLNPNIVWMLPHGDVPYKPNEAPEGTEHTILAQEARNLYNYVKMDRSRLNLPEVIGNNHINMAQREMMFIQMLEGLHTKEAQLVILAKDKLLSKNFKGLTATCVCEAFEWSDTFEPR